MENEEKQYSVGFKSYDLRNNEFKDNEFLITINEHYEAKRRICEDHKTQEMSHDFKYADSVLLFSYSNNIPLKIIRLNYFNILNLSFVQIHYSW